MSGAHILNGDIAVARVCLIVGSYNCYRDQYSINCTALLQQIAFRLCNMSWLSQDEYNLKHFITLDTWHYGIHFLQ